MKPNPMLVVYGFVAAAVLILGIRALRYRDPHAHYHANFAIFINGQREELKDPSFYEEISSCSASDVRPQHRAHLHDKVSDVVHVHDKIVTWGALLANIRYGAGGDYLATPTKLFAVDDTHKLHFILNGNEVSSVANTVIGDKDRLLISYSDQNDAAIQKQFAGVTKTAEAVDKGKDPGACMSAEDMGPLPRLKALF